MAVKHGRIVATEAILLQQTNSTILNDAASVTGLTPLHLAAHYRHEGLMKILLAAGADKLVS